MKEKGITLIEILIYTFLVGLVISLIVGIMSNFFLFRGIYLSREEVARSISYLLENLKKEISGADAILVPLPRKTAPELVLEKNGKNLSFKLKDGIIIKEKEGKSLPLTPSNLDIKSLYFSHLRQGGDGPSSIKIEIGVEYRNPLHLKEYQYFALYETAVVKRK
ncbi:MAG: hypothetical protein LR000_01715 [Candidatus Pacebacteria bacterium]|nr:hypothetical protein [Candidatus Paceibacterota bacterium]